VVWALAILFAVVFRAALEALKPEAAILNPKNCEGIS
jgi:hypothetical protein